MGKMPMPPRNVQTSAPLAERKWQFGKQGLLCRFELVFFIKTEFRAHLLNGLILPDSIQVLRSGKGARCHSIDIQSTVQMIYLVLQYPSVPTLRFDGNGFSMLI